MTTMIDLENSGPVPAVGSIARPLSVYQYFPPTEEHEWGRSYLVGHYPDTEYALTYIEVGSEYGGEAWAYCGVGGHECFVFPARSIVRRPPTEAPLISVDNILRAERPLRRRTRRVRSN